MTEINNKISNEKYFNAFVQNKTNTLIFQINTKVVKLVWEQIEPLKENSKTAEYVYANKRPNESYIVYILNKNILYNLAEKYWKSKQSIHIHECINTDGWIICWPEKINSIEWAKDILKVWAWMLGALFLSKDKNDLNEFVDSDNTNWAEDSIQNAWINVNIK